MIRKLIAMLLCVAVAASIITVSAFADATPNYLDYVPSGLTGNFMDKLTGYSDNAVRITVTESGANRIYDLGTEGKNWSYSHVGDNLIFDGSGMENGKIYVATYRAKNMAPATVSNPRFGLGVNYGNGLLGHVDAEITSTDWQTVKGYFNPPSTATTYALTLGYYSSAVLSDEYISTIPGASVMVDTDSIYIAEETAYDITNDLIAGSENMSEGSTATFKAEVLNQIELPGHLSQDINWRVMNKARTADVEGFEITTGENGTAAVKVNGAAPGKYDVVAYSADYNMAKGYEITVSDAAEEVTQISVDMETAGVFTLNGIKVENTKAEKIFVAVASYEGNRLEDVESESALIFKGVATLTDPITIKATTGNRVRVFIWKGLAPVKLANGVVAEFTR